MTCNFCPLKKKSHMLFLCFTFVVKNKAFQEQQKTKIQVQQLH